MRGFFVKKADQGKWISRPLPQWVELSALLKIIILQTIFLSAARTKGFDQTVKLLRIYFHHSNIWFHLAPFAYSIRSNLSMPCAQTPYVDCRNAYRVFLVSLCLEELFLVQLPESDSRSELHCLRLFLIR
jgi:hypothetical protein